MQWTFGTFLWSMLVFFFWFMFIWMFISVFADIFRRDMSGWGKAGWILLVVVFPFLGILIYMIARPKAAEQERWLSAGGRESQRGVATRSVTDEIAKAAKLHQDGTITADEFARLKQQALSY